MNKSLSLESLHALLRASYEREREAQENVAQLLPVCQDQQQKAKEAEETLNETLSALAKREHEAYSLEQKLEENKQIVSWLSAKCRSQSDRLERMCADMIDKEGEILALHTQLEEMQRQNMSMNEECTDLRSTNASFIHSEHSEGGVGGSRFDGSGVGGGGVGGGGVGGGRVRGRM